MEQASPPVGELKFERERTHSVKTYKELSNEWWFQKFLEVVTDSNLFFLTLTRGIFFVNQPKGKIAKLLGTPMNFDIPVHGKILAPLEARCPWCRCSGQFSVRWQPTGNRRESIWKSQNGACTSENSGCTQPPVFKGLSLSMDMAMASLEA
jgi:hypothetical protein